MSRPSDEMMVEVVKAWQGLTGRAAELSAAWCNKSGDMWLEDPDGNEHDDPREDTDAALELLHWIIHREGLCSFRSKVGWKLIDLTAFSVISETIIPISGEPFRYAVCNLAVEVVKNNRKEHNR